MGAGETQLLRAAGQEIAPAPVLDPTNFQALEVWRLVDDQVFPISKKVAVMRLEAVVPLIAMLGLPTREALFLLRKIKLIRMVLNKQVKNEDTEVRE